MESCVFQMAQLLAHTSGSGSFSSSNSLGSRGSSVVSIETQAGDENSTRPLVITSEI